MSAEQSQAVPEPEVERLFKCLTLFNFSLNEIRTRGRSRMDDLLAQFFFSSTLDPAGRAAEALAFLTNLVPEARRDDLAKRCRIIRVPRVWKRKWRTAQRIAELPYNELATDGHVRQADEPRLPVSFIEKLYALLYEIHTNVERVRTSRSLFWRNALAELCDSDRWDLQARCAAAAAALCNVVKCPDEWCDVRHFEVDAAMLDQKALGRLYKKYGVDPGLAPQVGPDTIRSASPANPKPNPPQD